MAITVDGGVGFDTRALTERVDRRDVRRFYAGFRRRNRSVRHRGDAGRRVAAVVGIGAALVGLLAMAYGVSEEIREAAPDARGQLVGMAFVVTLFAVGLGLLVWFWVRSRARRGTPERHYRLARFAAANGMSYQPGPYSGGHLAPWAGRGRLTLSRVMRTHAARPVEFANFELVTGPATGRSTRFGGYCAVRLETRLPHIVLLARHGGESKLAVEALPSADQRLGLEGDFDRHFSLHCPRGYERDALYLFTPDVMARLIDHVRGFDVEVVDDWVLLTRSADVVALDPRAWNGLLEATRALDASVRRWARWREDRLTEVPSEAVAVGAVGPLVAAPEAETGDGVDPRGRRLRTSTNRRTLLWLAVPVVVLVVNLLSRIEW